jgi:excisionase family DNA binding protein
MRQKNYAQDPLFTPPQAAEYLGISPGTLAVWRCAKRYPLAFIKVGRLVKYRQSELNRFLNDRSIGDVEDEN